MFTKTIAKQCPNPKCSMHDQQMEVGLNLCPESGDQLVSIVVRDTRALAIASLVTCLIVAGLTYLAVVSVEAWLARRATRATQNLVEITISTLKEQGPAAADEFAKKIGEFKKKGRVPAKDLAAMEVKVAEEKKRLDDVSKAVIEEARGVYQDSKVTPEEGAKLSDFIKASGFDGTWLREQVKAIENSMRSVSDGVEAGRAGDNGTAIKHFEDAVRLDGKNQMAFANLCAAYLAANDLVKAEYVCRTAVDLGSSSWIAQYNYGAFFAVKGDRERSLERLTNALSLLQKSPGLLTQVKTQMGQDEMLISLRDDGRFRQLLQTNQR